MFGQLTTAPDETTLPQLPAEGHSEGHSPENIPRIGGRGARVGGDTGWEGDAEGGAEKRKKGVWRRDKSVLWGHCS